MSGAIGGGGWVHGSTIDKATGRIRFTSVSAMELAKDCLRRYVFQYLHGLKSPMGDAAARGQRCHDEAEQYLLTGNAAKVSSQVAKGLSNMPRPGADLSLEWDLLKRPGEDIIITRENSAERLAAAPLTAAGIAMTGAIDVLSFRGTNRNEGSEENDPPGTVEVFDHKFPGKPRRTKSHELIEMIQMAGYARWVYNVRPDTTLVRLSHGIVPVTGKAVKVTALVDEATVNRTWSNVEALARSMKDAVLEPDPNKVDANTDVCFKYGQPCPAKHRCAEGNYSVLDELFGEDKARSVMASLDAPLVQIRPKAGNPLAENPVSEDMGIKDKLAEARAKAAASPDVKAEMVRLIREEVAAKAPRAADLFGRIAATGAEPVYTGDLAKYRSALKGTEIVLNIPGSGGLAEYSLATYEDLLEFSEALFEGESEPAEPPTAAPGGPPADSEVIDAESAEVVAAVTEEAKPESPKASSRRRTKADATPPPIVEQASTGGVIHVYVDCLPNVATQSLWPIINRIMEALAEDSGASDVRLADQNSKYGFGRWKAGLAACLRAKHLDGGHYSLDGSFGDIAQEVIGVMRQRALDTGGIFVRGVR